MTPSSVLTIRSMALTRDGGQHGLRDLRHQRPACKEPSDLVGQVRADFQLAVVSKARQMRRPDAVRGCLAAGLSAAGGLGVRSHPGRHISALPPRSASRNRFPCYQWAPRAVLMRMAQSFIKESARPLIIIWRVESSAGACSETTSLSASSVSKSAFSRPWRRWRLRPATRVIGQHIYAERLQQLDVVGACKATQPTTPTVMSNSSVMTL